MHTQKTALYDYHKNLGAKFVPFAGYEMPVQYSSGIIEEHKLTRSNAGLFDVSHMGQLSIEGSEDLTIELEKIIPTDLKKIKYKTKDIFKDINKFTGTKYIWGGKHHSGIDCSGLIQLFFNYNNKFCPRDAKDQIKYFKKKIEFRNISKNDLIFWKGHVAIVISKSKLIHAYGPFKKVVVMPIKKTINRIYKTANLKIIGIRRLG